MRAHLTRSAGFYWRPHLWKQSTGFCIFFLGWILIVQVPAL